MKFDNRFVFYSKTDDNPYIDQIYIQQLRRDMSPKEARRYLDGEWIEISGEVIYSEYDKDKQFIRSAYTVDKRHPIIMCWDFNASLDKPMSMCLTQYIDDIFHVYAEVIINGARTMDALDELELNGHLMPDVNYIVCGDASGKHRDTRSLRSDYDIITQYLSRVGINYEYMVPPANPPIRKRHNLVNAYCKNALGDIRLFVYSSAPTVDEGLRLTKLKKGAGFVEDDSKAYQHCVCALGYGICMMNAQVNRQKQGTVML